ncbi:MAG: ABC transporter [bacterium]|nr:ABC transporter [bacterium]
MTVPTELTRRLEALTMILDAGEGIVSPEAAAQAAATISHATDRLLHGSEFTVAALAGATGSGKSSVFNAIVGEDIAAVGMTRPTTSEARAAVFGDGDAGPLLGWLGIKHRHGIRGPAALAGLVLIDLPDHDSVQVSHRLQVDHFVDHADLLIWVLDPQKYADQALHEPYLSRLAAHSGSMAFLLHQADRLPLEEHPAWRGDAERLLATDGITDPTVLVTSTVSGQGMNLVTKLLATRVEGRNASLARIDGDLKATAAAIGDLRVSPTAKDSKSSRRQLAAGLADAVGAGLVQQAVGDGYRHDAAEATGWPFTRWIKRLRRHPLRRLRPSAPATTGPVSAVPVDGSRLDLALKTYADSRAGDAPPAWTRKLRGTVTAERDGLVRELGNQITTVAGISSSPPRWWGLFAWLQRILALTAAAGAAWLLVLLVLDWLRVPSDRVTPEIGGWPLPTVLLLGGAVLGLLIAAISRGIANVAAKRRGRRAAKEIATAIERVAEQRIAAPANAELARWSDIADAVAIVAGAAT